MAPADRPTIAQLEELRALCAGPTGANPEALIMVERRSMLVVLDELVELRQAVQPQQPAMSDLFTYHPPVPVPPKIAVLPSPNLAHALPAAVMENHGERIQLTPHRDGVLAEVWFAGDRGGGAAVGRDLDHARRLAAEIVAVHEGKRHG